MARPLPSQLAMATGNGLQESPPNRVLVVSADRVYAARVQERLSASGCRVQRATGTGEVDEHVLVTADVAVVETTGRDTLQWQLVRRALALNPLLEVVVIVTDPAIEEAVRALRTGVFAVLEYPVSAAQLVTTVAAACTRKRRAEARMTQLDGQTGLERPTPERSSK